MFENRLKVENGAANTTASVSGTLQWMGTAAGLRSFANLIAQYDDRRANLSVYADGLLVVDIPWPGTKECRKTACLRPGDILNVANHNVIVFKDMTAPKLTSTTDPAVVIDRKGGRRHALPGLPGWIYHHTHYHSDVVVVDFTVLSGRGQDGYQHRIAREFVDISLGVKAPHVDVANIPMGKFSQGPAKSCYDQVQLNWLQAKLAVKASHCSDERPCTPCFTDDGLCEDEPWSQKAVSYPRGEGKSEQYPAHKELAAALAQPQSPTGPALPPGFSVLDIATFKVDTFHFDAPVTPQGQAQRELLARLTSKDAVYPGSTVGLYIGKVERVHGIGFPPGNSHAHTLTWYGRINAWYAYDLLGAQVTEPAIVKEPTVHGLQAAFQQMSRRIQQLEERLK